MHTTKVEKSERVFKIYLVTEQGTHRVNKLLRKSFAVS